ncbi:G-patch domain and KOW motifs-containing protein [Megachile rotundata]|uniref:G-patch domain and KOW motifs-containing protein n=1 Tax=Megachile rotundata TaxID=143995 RepID=UPI0006152391|nr:PREDICTED: G patch domain and KOW motifs-containing protein [Megachile rotundata]
MAEEGKKISFGFAKSIKKPILKTTVPQEQKKVDYIECLDEKGIKVIGEEEKKDEPLVIPLLGSKTWHDRIINKIDADIFETKTIKEEPEDVSTEQKQKSYIPNGSTSPKISVKTEPIDDNGDKAVTLEEQAAKEIINDLESKEKEQQSQTCTLTLPLTEDPSLRGREQSTLEDYERIPVDAFGLAMLRGMGWQPGKGIGKNEKVVSAVVPELRPKGMGLGADKVTLQKKTTDSKKTEEELKIEKGTFVKIIAGKQSNNYGQIEGFDDDAGRLIIKLALGGNIISVNEFMVQPVTKSEYSKNSKVLNAKKYEEYKDKASTELKRKTDRMKRSASVSSEDSETDDKNNESVKKKKDISYDRKSRRRKRYSKSDNEDDSDYEKRRKKGTSISSESSDSYESKKSKKSKKHKKSLPERSSKKHKKKDKEREKTRDRRSRDFSDKRKHKKRGKSRSRSSSKR